MSDYSLATSPSNLSGAYDPNSAFADALQRAKQVRQKIAAKITPNSEIGTPVVGGTKRPLEEPPGMNWGERNVPKKMAALNDPIGAQLAAMQQQHRMGGVQTEEIQVPDKMVGLIIGRGGEQITRLQADSGCKIQMAADSGGLPDRSCSLTGSQIAIDKAKEMMMDIINRGSSSAIDTSSISDGQATVEMPIPASKVGLIIGKGGETIKSLQERAGVKMIMIQDEMFANASEKPLRIKGDPQKAEYARQLILDLLTERELEVQTNMNRGGFNRNQHQQQTNDYGSAQQPGGSQSVSVPRQAVGVVIGKGGDMIKKIQQDSGARVQFQQDDGPGDRVCFLSGAPKQVQQAQEIIHELINSVLQRDQQNMGRGRGRGRGGGGGGGGGFDNARSGGGGRGDFQQGNHGMGRGSGMGNGGGAGPPPLNRGGPPDWAEITYSIPAAKCGVVIGKGGETIRNINHQTGAHVELSRNPPPNPNEKIFVIRGLPNQIDHAKQLINEKVGGGGGGPPQNYLMNQGPHTGPPNAQFSQNNQQPPPQQQPSQPGPQGFAPQGWGNAYPQQWPGANAGQPNNDQSKQTVDAWTAYYAQYYNQPQQSGQPNPGPTGQAPLQQQQTSQPSGVPAPATATAQPDYSAAWAEYYRSLGMFREAEMIEQQARQSQQGGGQPPATPQQAPSALVPSVAPQLPQQQQQPLSQPPTAQGQPPYVQYGNQYGPTPQYGQPQQQQQGQVPPQQPGPYPSYNYGPYQPQQ